MDATNKIRGSLNTLFEPDAVIELRAFRDKKVRSGYFDDHDRLAEVASELDREKWSVYTTLNEVNPNLLARSANRMENYPAAATSDKDIIHRRWLPIDLDPVRPSNVSATTEEFEKALARAQEIDAFLTQQGWPESVKACSGNGMHLLYRVDLPNDPESTNLVKSVLSALAFRFDDERVKVDIGVHNAARIWKLYGTKARKGDSVQERKHRRSYIKEVLTEVTV